MSGVELMLPPGFRFHPSDEELVTHYLCRRCAGLPISVPIIAEVDLYKYDPWQLPGMAQYGEKEWYFFSPRNRKYPNGSRPNRAAGSGYWKATGADKPIGSPKAVAIKKALVFYSGKAPKGVKTNWIMHEYRLAGVDRSVRKKNSLRMDDWVLCRLYHKKGGSEGQMSKHQKPQQQEILWHEPKPKSNSRPPVTGMLCFDASDSPPRLRSDSSCGSAHVTSSEFTCDKEVESQLRRDGWENTLDLSLNNVDAAMEFPLLSPAFQDSLQDLFVYLQKPF